MNATHMAARIALVAEALDSIGVEPLHINVHDSGEVSVLVRPEDHARTTDRLGLSPSHHVANDLALGRWADIAVWLQAYREPVEVAAS